MKISFIQSEQQHLVALLMSFLKTLPYMVNSDRSIYFVKKDMDPLFDKKKGYLRNAVLEYSETMLNIDVEKLNPLQTELIYKYMKVDLFCRHISRNDISKYIAEINMTQAYIDLDVSLRDKFEHIFHDGDVPVIPHHKPLDRWISN